MPWDPDLGSACSTDSNELRLYGVVRGKPPAFFEGNDKAFKEGIQSARSGLSEELRDTDRSAV